MDRALSRLRAMDTAVVVALVALVGTVANALVILFGQSRSSKREARREAEAVLARYRDPLASAAYDLQSRIYNIFAQDFLKIYLTDGASRRDVALDSTLYVFGQYFAWTEILRQEVEFLNFPDDAETRKVSGTQDAIRGLFATDAPDLGGAFMVWRAEQRGIGECMIESEREELRCLGFARFAESWAKDLGRWFSPLKQDLDLLANGGSERLRQIQNELVDLVHLLDPDRVRFMEPMRKL